MMFLSTTNFFLPIIILLAISSIASIVLFAFKINFLPIFAIEIVIGIIIANPFNGYMSDLGLTNFVEGIYVVGLSLMMFLSGYEVEFGDFKEHASMSHNQKHISIFKMTVLITILTYAASLIVSLFLSSYMLTNKVVGVLLLTLMFASTFAGFVVPILVSDDLHETVIGKMLMAIANLSEALSILFLTLIMIFVDVDPQYWLIILTVGLILVVFRLFKKYRIGSIFEKITEGIDHLSTRIIFVLILLFVFLSDLSGGEYIFGAFLAGIIIRQAKFSKEVIHSIERIIYGVFAPMFFILVGTQIDISLIVSSSENIFLVVLIFFGLLIVELPMLFLLKCYQLNTVIPSMFLMASTIIVPIAISHVAGSHGLGIFSDNFSQALILAGLLVCVIGATLFQVNLQFGKKRHEFRIVSDEIEKNYEE